MRYRLLCSTKELISRVAPITFTGVESSTPRDSNRSFITETRACVVHLEEPRLCPIPWDNLRLVIRINSQKAVMKYAVSVLRNHTSD